MSDVGERKLGAVARQVELRFGAPLRQVLLDALNRGGSIEAAADELSVSRQTVYGWISEFNLVRRAVWEQADQPTAATP